MFLQYSLELFCISGFLIYFLQVSIWVSFLWHLKTVLVHKQLHCSWAQHIYYKLRVWVCKTWFSSSLLRYFHYFLQWMLDSIKCIYIFLLKRCLLGFHLTIQQILWLCKCLHYVHLIYFCTEKNKKELFLIVKTLDLFREKIINNC